MILLYVGLCAGSALDMRCLSLWVDPVESGARPCPLRLLADPLDPVGLGAGGHAGAGVAPPRWHLLLRWVGGDLSRPALADCVQWWPGPLAPELVFGAFSLLLGFI